MIIKCVSGKEVKIDEEDYELVSKYKWYDTKMVGNRYYACAYVEGKRVFMHRLILDTPDNLEVIHFNDDLLDNRKCNIKNYTHQQISWLKCGAGNANVKGITQTPDGTFTARISYCKHPYYLGTYKTREEANYVYNLARSILRGKFVESP